MSSAPGTLWNWILESLSHLPQVWELLSLEAAAVQVRQRRYRPCQDQSHWMFSFYHRYFDLF